MNIYHEARGESFEGQIAVAEVVIQRMNDTRWPDTSCEVVWQDWQFSWTREYEFKDINAKRHSIALSAARIAATGTTFAQGADHYHTIDILPPDWADNMEVVNVIGNHIFYRSQ
ncbi:MAG: cell wall hydrolase [Desulfobulbaceae bacterium]|nr:cell wall hydrolase [Desulfobulbaceae bacterium]